MRLVEDQQPERARAWARAIDTLRNSQANEQVLSVVIHEATWYVPLRDKQPQFADLRYWSRGALDASGGATLRRDHVTTRSEAKLLLEEARDAATIERVLGAMVVCVVTDKEHKMLNTFGEGSGWDRYRAVRLRVYDRRDSRWLW